MIVKHRRYHHFIIDFVTAIRLNESESDTIKLLVHCVGDFSAVTESKQTVCVHVCESFFFSSSTVQRN